MNDKTMEQRATEEIERLNGLLADFNVKEKKIAVMQPVIENTAWMKVKLDDARTAIKTSNVVIPYDNGGGQTGIRENPLFKGYESLWKSYMAGMDRICSMLPREQVEAVAEQIETPKTVLQMVREKHKGTA